MSRIQIFGFVLVLLLILFTSVKKIQADISVSNCPNSAIPDPTDLNSKSDNAQFTVNIDSLFDRGVSNWEAEFECGIRHQTVRASSNADERSITTSRIDRSRNPVEGCEFFPGSHTLLIKGDGTPRCRADYNVVDADTQCILTVEPPTGLTPAIEIKVSGQNLTDGARFNLYLDSDELGGGGILASSVRTPSFSPITIPREKRSPITHVVYLKRFLEPWNHLPPPFSSPLGPILCPVQFTIGTVDNPGEVIPSPSGGGTGPVSKPCVGPGCTLGGGKSISGCGTDQDPAISTAIGCIRTSPAGLTQDFLRFVIGIGGGLAFLMMLLGAFQMLTSAGNPEILNAGRQRLTNAIIGLLFIIFAILLLQIIGAGILNIPGFK